MCWYSLLIGITLLCAHSAATRSAPSYIRKGSPELLTYGELLKLSESAEVATELNKKLNTLLTTPFINNEAYYRGAKPHKPSIPKIGSSLRVVFWNIERGLRLDDIKLAFTDRKTFLARAEAQAQSQAEDKADKDAISSKLKQIGHELDILQSADLVVLNELDWGMKRTGYRAVVQELGDALHMNWAYGVEFIEVDPMVLGTEKFEEVEDPADRAKMLKAVQVDPARIRCLHGSAVLSRYPIREAKVVPFKDKGYDWYKGEQNIGAIEKGKRTAAILVGEKLTREIRRGGRTNLIVTLDVPDLREGVLTVADTHLENRADPEDRRNQGKELLTLLKPIRNPIVIAGDLNTTGSKGLPRGMVETVKNKMGESSFWISQGVKYGTGFGAVYGVLVGGYKQLRFQSDPTTPGVKFVAENPEAATFNVLENFRFADGRAIDFRGDAAHTVNGTSGTLADSNQRAGKGFAATFQFERTIGAKGKFKLDWIFVKSYINNPREEKQPYIFAPHFARRMFDVDYALKERMSDHTPISVDLPFTDPQLK